MLLDLTTISIGYLQILFSSKRRCCVAELYYRIIERCQGEHFGDITPSSSMSDCGEIINRSTIDVIGRWISIIHRIEQFEKSLHQTRLI